MAIQRRKLHVDRRHFVRPQGSWQVMGIGRHWSVEHDPAAKLPDHADYLEFSECWHRTAGGKRDNCTRGWKAGLGILGPSILLRQRSKLLPNFRRNPRTKQICCRLVDRLRIFQSVLRSGDCRLVEQRRVRLFDRRGQDLADFSERTPAEDHWRFDRGQYTYEYNLGAGGRRGALLHLGWRRDLEAGCPSWRYRLEQLRFCILSR